MHLYRAERAGGGRTAGAAAAESPTAGVHPYPLRGISSYGIYFPYVCRRPSRAGFISRVQETADGYRNARNILLNSREAAQPPFCAQPTMGG